MEVPTLVYRFGIFELDTASAELRRSGRRVPLQEQPFAVLVALLERSGEIVGRDELRHRLWPPDVHVDFNNGINAAVARLREALDDVASNPRFVVTVPRRGYRFIAPVHALEEPAPETPEPEESVSEAQVSATGFSGRYGLGTLAKLIVLAGVVLVLWTAVTASLHRWYRVPEAISNEPYVRLAVLPFTNLGADPQREFLSDALTEELITLLGRLQPERLRVIARTSSMVYKGAEESVLEIGRGLGVEFILEGSVRQEGSTVRVNTALVEIAGQTQLWSSSFDRPLGSLISLEREIASEVVSALTLELLGAGAISTVSGRAHELYLEGRYFLSQLTEEGFHKAIRAFEAALVEEPRSAAAHSGLAQSWALLGIFDFVGIAEAYPRALVSAKQALEFEPSSAEGHLVLAVVRYLYEWDFAGAAVAIDRALELNPSLVWAHLVSADLQTSLGQREAASGAVERALALDPLSLAVNAEACWKFFVLGREEEAIARCHRAIELDGDFLQGWDALKWIHIRRQDEEEAIAAFLRVVELEELHAEQLPYLRQVAARDGILGLLRDSLKANEGRLSESGQSPYNLALDYAALGEIDAAFVWLERSFEARETDLVHLAVDPRLDLLRGDARLSEMLKRMGLVAVTGEIAQ